MGGEVSTDFKSSNRIEISRLVQVLWNFEWFRGSPLGGVGGWMGVWGGERVHPTHMQDAHAYEIIGNSQVFPQWFSGSHLHEIIMFTTHACVCMCMHVHMWGGTPQPSPTPTTHPQSHREPETPKFNKSWTNRDNSILFWRFFTSEHFWTHIDYSWSPQTPTHLPHPPEPRKPKSEELQ